MKRSFMLNILREILIAFSIAIFLIPVYYSLINAFKSNIDISLKPFLLTLEMFTLDNLAKTFQRLNYFSALKTNSFIALLSLALLVFLCSLGSFPLARIKNKFFEHYYIGVVTSMVIPFTISLIPVILVLKSIGILRTIWAPIAVQVAWNAPLALFLYTGFMRGLPRELEEAAYLDGCNMFEVYFRIFMPLMKPVTATCLIVIGLGIWNDFLVCFVTLNPNLYPTLQVGLYSFFGKYVQEYNLAFAGILMVSTPIIILFLFLQRYFIKGIAAGAIKG